MAYATVKIEGNKIISTSLWNTHTFEIVKKIPGNYFVWNIGENMGTDFYIPICQMLRPGDKEDFSINPDTLKAVPVTSEECKALQKAASYGVNSLKTTEKALRSKRHGYMSDKKRGLATLTIDIFKRLTEN